MQKIMKQLLLGAVLALSFLPSSFAGDTLQRVVDFKTLRVGMSADQPPMTAINREGGVMGFDVDLARAMASVMRVQLDIQVMPFGDLLNALDEGKIDMVMSNMSITPERAGRAFFVGPYMMAGKSILTRDSVLGNAKSSGDLDKKELKLAAIKSGTSAMFVRENAPNAQLIEVKTSDEGAARLIAGEVDALIADIAICKLAVLRHRDAGLVTLSQPLTIEPVGIAIKADDQQFRNLVANYLDAFGKTGMLAAMRKKWFEQSDWVVALP